jgi:hypothetical protein
VSADNEPDWLAELAKSSEALRRQMESIVQAAEQFVRDSRQAKTTGGPALPFAQRVALAVDAGMRELLPARIDAIVHPATLQTSVTFPAPTVITGSGGVTLPKPSLSGQGTVEDRRSGLAALSDGQLVFLVLVWLYAFMLPWFGAALPPEFHAVLSDHYATMAIALGITWRMLDKRK